MKDRIDIINKIRDIRIMPLFYHPDPDISLHVMQAVFDGGLDLMEFTNRGPNAFNVFEKLYAFKSKNYPGAALGIGSIVDAPTAAQYIQAGVDFIVSPLLNHEVIRVCNRRKVLHIPGCSTLSEISQAEEWGAELVKVFPAAQLGGPAFIKAIMGPCPWASIVVTGGVKADYENLKAWHDAGVVGFGIGSDLISKDLVSEGDYAGLTRKVQELVGIISKLGQ
ncbi:MAG: keto-deoxy-phosphogluconate aldolase [Bacteroides sp. SM1_62]|nr:MAG: keto-deoxy-phosphogluconate aldolase [Bacteroides sp. SM23_62]KPL26360.1 MAG: keto-deoxy-phosphogluconate aldolase [Bacteroides sp. SM1_62]